MALRILGLHSILSGNGYYSPKLTLKVKS